MTHSFFQHPFHVSKLLGTVQRERKEKFNGVRERVTKQSWEKGSSRYCCLTGEL